MLNDRGGSSGWKYEWKSLEMIWSKVVDMAISWKSEIVQVERMKKVEENQK